MYLVFLTFISKNSWIHLLICKVKPEKADIFTSDLERNKVTDDFCNRMVANQTELDIIWPKQGQEYLFSEYVCKLGVILQEILWLQMNYRGPLLLNATEIFYGFDA